MRKLNVVVPFLLVIVIISTSCTSFRNNVMPDENVTVAKPSSDNGGSLKINSLEDKSIWSAVSGVATNYVKLDDINPDAVSELKLGLNIDVCNSYIIKETVDGVLYGYTITRGISYVSKYTKHAPRIRKFDRAGRIVWEKEYDYETYSGKINNIVAYPDGSFIFSLQTYPNFQDNGLISEKSFIIKCDKDGKKLWKCDFDDYSGGLLSNLFISENGDIIAVGQWRSKDGMQIKDGGADDIVITKLDMDGNVLKQKSFGGSDFDSLNVAKYESKLGIIINGRTQSSDGDFVINTLSKDQPSAAFIACIGENLDLKWVVQTKENENFVYDQLALSNDFVYVPGYYFSADNTPNTRFLVKLDKSGNRVWTKSQFYAGMWGRCISILENGDIAIGSGQQNQGIIVVLDKNGIEKKRLEDLKFAPNEITPTSDGGYIVTAIREIKPVPQPLYVSSIWYDTELVAVKYKSDHTVEWRKTYDRYKNERGLDFVFSLKKGKIIVQAAMN